MDEGIFQLATKKTQQSQYYCEDFDAAKRKIYQAVKCIHGKNQRFPKILSATYIPFAAACERERVKPAPSPMA